MAEGSEKKPRRKPSQTYDADWIWQSAPAHCCQGETLGKWLVYKFPRLIDETWEAIRERVESGELGATGAKVSTMRENPIASDKYEKVICVYTTEEDMDAVGLRLIQLVKQNIKYKKDETTLEGRYSWMGHGKVSCRTLLWNDGSPRFKS